VPDNRKDEYSSFKLFVQQVKRRDLEKNRKEIPNITPVYLKKIWETQLGICPITGWQLILPKNAHVCFDSTDPRNASLDRIDNAIGYMQGNVRFVSLMANYARNNFTDEQVFEFCRAVAANHTPEK
jgi:hypothetical protein